MTTARYNAKLHTIALLTAAATLPLIFMGGLVTSKQAGMSVPDWPNSYGYNMFLFPPSKWIGGIFYEHTHRLMGTVVGLLSIFLAIAAWKWESRRWAKWLCISVLPVVIVQGVIGGQRVTLVKLGLAIVHACSAQVFFCFAALAAIITSRWWIEQGRNQAQSTAAVPIVSVICVGVIFSQLIVGALMRHHDAGLAIPDLPLAYGKILPPTDQPGLDQINHMRSGDFQLPPVTLSQVWLHFGHRIGATLVTLAVLATSITTLLKSREIKLRAPAMLVSLLLAVQLTLGVLTVLDRKPADIASLHVAVGALTLVTAFVLCVRSIRIMSLSTARNRVSVVGSLHFTNTVPV